MDRESIHGYDLYYGSTEPDNIDRGIMLVKIEMYNNIFNQEKPKVGEYVIMPDGSYQRFSYELPGGIQTSEYGSFHLCNGYSSFSGSLNKSIPYEKIKATSEVKKASFWFAHHNYLCAGCSVYCSFPVKVWRVI